MKKLFALGAALITLSGIFLIPSSKASVAFHQYFIEGRYKDPENVVLDTSDPEKVLSYVFSALDNEVTVYPTENYYYFIFKANGKEFWGNLRLAPEERDRGILNFAYWEKRPDRETTEENSFYKQYGPADGISIKKISDLRYGVTYKDREVIFNLNKVPQTPPKFRLAKGEVFLQRTLDESGFGFYLIYNKLDPHFIFVLDEDRKVPDSLAKFNEDILVGEKSKFVFYLDKENGRKLLMGVNLDNIDQNTYYDGPFDQLADNYINGTDFKNYLEATYPSVRGLIDNYGRFKDYAGARVAIMPYYPYTSPEWVYGIIKECRKSYVGSKFYDCITHDEKENAGNTN